MSVGRWVETVLEGVRGELADNLAAQVLAVSADSGVDVAAPAAIAVQDDTDTVAQLPFVAIRADETDAVPVIPRGYRLQIPLVVTAVLGGSSDTYAGPTGPARAGHTYCRAILNCLTLNETLGVSGVYWGGLPRTRVDRVEGDGHRWRREAVVSVTVYVVATRTET